MDITTLVDQLDAALADGLFDSDVQRTSIIAIELCELLLDRLSSSQRAAIVAARDYWESGVDSDRLRFVEKFAKIIDEDQRRSVESEQRAMNRLVWTALNTNTGLSSYMCEFLVELGADSGLNADQMKLVFLKNGISLAS